MFVKGLACLVTVLLPVLCTGYVSPSTAPLTQSHALQAGSGDLRVVVNVVNDSQPVLFTYEVQTATNYYCPDFYWQLVKCDNENDVKEYWVYRESGKYCVKDEGCYRLKCGSLLSQSFNLSGTAVQHKNPVLVSDTVLLVEFLELPEWILGWEVFVVDNQGTIAGRTVTAHGSRTVHISGNYIIGDIYYLWYTTVPRENVAGRCSARHGLRRNGNFIMSRNQTRS